MMASLGVETAGLEENAVGCGDLADVVEEGAAGDDFEFVGRKPMARAMAMV